MIFSKLDLPTQYIVCLLYFLIGTITKYYVFFATLNKRSKWQFVVYHVPRASITQVSQIIFAST